MIIYVNYRDGYTVKYKNPHIEIGTEQTSILNEHGQVFKPKNEDIKSIEFSLDE